MRKWLALAAIAIFAFGGFWLYRWWQSPAESVLVTTSGQTQQGVLGTESNLLPWQTTYFSTSYPDTLRILKRNEVSRGNVLAQYLLSSVSTRQTDQLAVTVGRLQGGPLSELSAVQFRARETATYEATTRAYLPEGGGFAFSKLDGYETSVYWQQDDEYAAAVVSGSSVRKAELEAALQAVVTNWVWR